MATAMTTIPAWEVSGATAGTRQRRRSSASGSPPALWLLAHHHGYSRGPKWKTWLALPCELEASQETPLWLTALVTFRVRELLTQPCPPGTGSVDCGGLGQARPIGSRAAVRAEVMSIPSGSRKGDTVREQGPLGVWGGHLGPRGFRVEGRVPYTVALGIPGEFGLWVAAGRADEPDFIAFSPAALSPLSLLVP